MKILEIPQKFPSNESCIEYLESVRWKDGIYCPYRGKKHKTGKKQKDGRLMCSNRQKNFGVTVGTIFHATKVPLQKWYK